MKISFTEAAWENYLWLQENDKKLLKRVNLLVKDILRNPFDGIGKPEPLKANLSGYWSRRIDSEHRLVYSLSTEEVIIISCRFHYVI
jgi:toxin YoeB